METIREAIHQLKYQNARHLAPVLVIEMLRGAPSLPSSDLIVPIPLHPARQARRGYNQAELLARELGDRLGIAVSPDCLRRVRDTPSQISLPAARRQTNVRDAFAIGPRSVAGLAVLLVDDVATTGSTLSEAARRLKGGGARRVDALVVARAP